MIRTLVMIAVAGFAVSLVTISAAVGIAGPQAILDGGWTLGPAGWGDHHHWRSGDEGPQATRNIPWSGGDALDIDLPADVTYTQAAGPAKITVSGPRDAISDLEIQDGHIGYVRHSDHDSDLIIAISAPAVRKFTMESSGKLAIEGYNQDRLELSLEGDADATVKGAAKAVQLSISGSANADLAALAVQTAKVEIDGSGDATLKPTAAADISLSGSGDATLLSDPPRLQTHISGSGEVRRNNGETQTAGKDD